MTITDFGSFWPDSRANRLEHHRLVNVRDSEERRLYLRCSDATARQVRWILLPEGCERIQLRKEDKPDWTHRYRLPAGLSPGNSDSLELLKEVLTLEAPEVLEAVIALDFYKDPSSHEDPWQWRNTRAGQLVNAGKYAFGQQEQAIANLATALAAVVNRHPLYRGADVLIPVPGHDTRHRSFSQRVAMALAVASAKTLCHPSCRTAVRPAAKNDQFIDFALDEEFTFDSSVHGRVVIVVDDVYRTGRTLAAVARAAKDAGAVAALGLIGARTMRT